MTLMALAILLAATVADDKDDKQVAKSKEDNTKKKDAEVDTVVNVTVTAKATLVDKKKEKNTDKKADKTADKKSDNKIENGDETSTETTAIDEESELTIEINPEYVSDDEDESDYESEDEYDSEDEEEEDTSKAVLDTALAQTRKVSRKAIEYAKKNRVKITLALALIAFRREIGRMVLNKIAPAAVDPVTGKLVRKWMKIEPTAVLKIVVFVDIMRQLQGAGKKRDPLIIAFLLLGAKNPILSSLISKTILQENNSYVPPAEQHYTFEKLNERYKKDCLALQKASSHKSKTDLHLPSLASLGHGAKPAKEYSETVIVLDLIGVDSARIDRLRDEVSFLLHQHREQTISYNTTTGSTDSGEENTTSKNVEVVVLLESPGGSASDFALASQQLLRLRNEPGIQVTVCVDKVAASGGYMIACASSPGRLFAAPFAVLGSIGVVGQSLNIQKTLEGWGIRPMVFRGGKEKAPLGLIGDVTSKQMKSIQSMVDDTHTAFKKHVVLARPVLAKKIDKVATGKIWLGASAMEVGLIDHIVTSDEYIGHRIQSGARLLKLIKNTRRRTLFGGPHSRGGFESRIKTSLLEPIRHHTKRALMNLAERIDIPAEDLMDAIPFSAKTTGVGSLASTHPTMYSTSASTPLP